MAKRKRRGRPRQRKRPPNQATIDYGPDALHLGGPVVTARWTAPLQVIERLQEEQKLPPPPVVGAVLLDTGASSTCISQAAARSLGLMPTRMAAGYGAAGQHQHPVYRARLELRIANKSGQSTYAFDREVQALPLEEISKVLGMSADGRPVDLIGLLGRDVLRTARFHYDGVRGRLQIRFVASEFQVA